MGMACHSGKKPSAMMDVCAGRQAQPWVTAELKFSVRMRERHGYSRSGIWSA